MLFMKKFNKCIWMFACGLGMASNDLHNLYLCARGLHFCRHYSVPAMVTPWYVFSEGIDILKKSEREFYVY